MKAFVISPTRKQKLALAENGLGIPKDYTLKYAKMDVVLRLGRLHLTFQRGGVDPMYGKVLADFGDLGVKQESTVGNGLSGRDPHL
ncbi:hypothetical protein JZ751_022562 [Albula glossodonta]|uniref:Uncharacterized protein n=1 Tax=Albula glossodonta TaxID=121402 RepID=A0A8T2PHW2_9TELE|nr:hypothetical protein JZ751_022562 [Albula glossodonta]